MKNTSISEFFGVLIIATLVVLASEPIKYRVLMGAHMMSPEEYNNALDASRIYSYSKVKPIQSSVIEASFTCQEVDKDSNGFVACKVYKGNGEDLNLQCPYQFSYEQLKSGDASCRLDREETESKGRITKYDGNFQ